MKLGGGGGGEGWWGAHLKIQHRQLPPGVSFFFQIDHMVFSVTARWRRLALPPQRRSSSASAAAAESSGGASSIRFISAPRAAAAAAANGSARSRSRAARLSVRYAADVQIRVHPPAVWSAPLHLSASVPKQNGSTNPPPPLGTDDSSDLCLPSLRPETG